MSYTQLGLEPAFGIDDTEDTQSNLASADQKSDIKKPEPQVFTVSDINAEIRGLLEGNYGRLWIRGEISNFKPHTSGHFYFSLKDQNAQISAVMFKGLNSKLKFRPENGLEVLVRGKITVYEPRGNYQVFCETMEPVGAGALQKSFEQLKQKLQREGLFENKRKRVIPSFPKHIGIVTSPTGAAVRDILKVLRRRHKSARITLAPAQVQGESAAQSIVQAIELINKLNDVDVLIVGRGGGSIEDLWCFNTEIVARTIATSRIPIISAVGHEIDFTIADFVADLRAPTPSAAAELVVRNAQEVADQIRVLQKRLNHNIGISLKFSAESLRGLKKRLIDPKRALQDLILRCDDLTVRLETAMGRFIRDRRMNVQLALRKIPSPRELIVRLHKRHELIIVAMKAAARRAVETRQFSLAKNMGRLDAMSPLRVVERGYSIVERWSGAETSEVVSRCEHVTLGDQVKIRLSNGQLKATVNEIKEDTSKI